MKDLQEETRTGLVSVIIMAIVFTAGVITPGILVLDYVHVLYGALWTGVDVFLGVIFFIVINNLDKNIKSDIAERLMPMTLYFIPAISVFTVSSGIALGIREKIIVLNPLFIGIFIIAGLLLLLTVIFVLPLSLRMYEEFLKENPSREGISKNLIKISKVAVVQLIFQVVIISLMAYIVVYP